MLSLYIKQSQVFEKKKKLCKISQLENEIEALDVNISINNNQELTLKRNLLKTELNELYKEDSMAAYLRSRAKWLEHGEKSSFSA